MKTVLITCPVLLEADEVGILQAFFFIFVFSELFFNIAAFMAVAFS